MHQNVSLGSNGLDLVHSVQKNPTRLRGTSFCTSSDESITPHIISTPNSCVISSKTDNSYLNCPVLQFGAIHFDLEHSGNRAKFASSGLSSNIIFNGAVLLKNEEKKIPRSWRD